MEGIIQKTLSLFLLLMIVLTLAQTTVQAQQDKDMIMIFDIEDETVHKAKDELTISKRILVYHTYERVTLKLRNPENHSDIYQEEIATRDSQIEVTIPNYPAELVLLRPETQEELANIYLKEDTWVNRQINRIGLDSYENIFTIVWAFGLTLIWNVAKYKDYEVRRK